MKKRRGFTIVELLIVIVIIGILAAITIVSFIGINNKATVASIQSDLSNAQTQLKFFLVDNSAYPNSVTDCPTPSTGNLCLRPSSGNVISSYSANNTTNPQTYSLTEMHGSLVYTITSTTTPTTLASAPLSPVADWLAMAQGDHYGNYYDLVSNQWATITRTTPKTIYDPTTNHIYDVPANYLGINPRSDGKSGSEAQIEETRTNYLLNSYGVTNSAGKWSTSWGFAKNVIGTPTYSLNSGTYSSNAQRIQYIGVAGDSSGWLQPFIQSSAISSFAAGETGTASLYLKGSVSVGVSVQIVLRAHDATTADIGGTAATVAVNSNWTKVSATYASLPANTSYVGIYLSVNGINNGSTVDISSDAVQLEKGPFSTSYIPTTTTTATRNTDVVTIPTTNWNSSAGTWVAVATDTLGTNLNPNLIGWGTGSGNQYNLFTHMSNGPYAQFVSGGVDASAVFSRLASYFTASVSWTAGSPLTLYCGGTSQNSSNNVTALTTPPVTTGIGRNPYATGSGNYNGPIQRIVVYNSALSPSDISTATAAVQNGP